MILPISNTSNNTRYTGGQSFRALALLSSIDKNCKNININSPDYIKYIYKLSKNMCRQVCEINVESMALQDIVKSREPAIFIMNHTKNQSKDIDAAVFFNTLLYREYLYNGLAGNCPRSKIMASKGFVKRAGEGGAEKLQWLGVVPVSASLKKDGKNHNAVVLRDLINEFSENKINIFLFPEGALAALTFLPANYKFQPGVSSIVKKSLEKVPKVKVIPLGFAHNNETSSIHIGEPVYFKKTNTEYSVTKGNANSEFFDKSLAEFYSGSDETIITDNGKPVEADKIIPFISGILLKNLECCTKEAKQDLHNSKPKVYVI